MTISDSELPQDWPDHLAPDAEISAVKAIPPIGALVLDFPAMDYATFEQFCLWLLKKEEALGGCMRLGGSGARQGGIDLLARDARQPARLNVFECKARKDFKPSQLRKAVSEFLNGAWAESTNRFTLILAQKTVGYALARQWLEEERRLREAGIEGVLWTAEDLTLKVQRHPDILSKFFSPFLVEAHANIWMERAAFYELASKSLFDPREDVARWARGFVGRSAFFTPGADSPAPRRIADGRKSSLVVDGTYRRVSQTGNNWQFNGPWLSVGAILPDPRFTRVSAAFNFNRPDMQGMTLTVDQRWLLTQFLFREGAPLSDRNRGFVFYTMPHGDGQYVIDFPHCRLTLQADGVEEIAGVADLLTEAVRTSLVALETAWSAVDFPFVTWSGRKVALGAVRADVWREIGRFAEAHHFSNGATPWHMFDGNRHVLKPYHQKTGQDFDAGYHGVIHAAAIDGLSHDGEVVLLWQPNGLSPDEALSPRGWWPCEFTFQWLSETLLPEVKRRVHARHPDRSWKRIFRARGDDALAAHLDDVFVMRDLRQRPLMRDGGWLAGILESVEMLQGFFTMAAGAHEPHIRQSEMEALYRTVALVARGNRGYVGYAGAKLGLRPGPANHADLVRMIEDHVREERVRPCCAVADNVFRAMREMLGDSDAWLSDADRMTIRTAIAPFARLHDDAILVDRHTNWD